MYQEARNEDSHPRHTEFPTLRGVDTSLDKNEPIAFKLLTRRRRPRSELVRQYKARRMDRMDMGEALDSPPVSQKIPGYRAQCAMEC